MEFSRGLVGSRMDGSGKGGNYLKVDLTCVKHLIALDKRKKKTSFNTKKTFCSNIFFCFRR